jgi:hypothetical protein
VRGSSTSEVLLHLFTRSFHLEELDVGTLLAWEDTTPCFEASTPLFPWNVELEEKITPLSLWDVLLS